jgi:putative ABC transport system ATP-binding protein
MDSGVKELILEEVTHVYEESHKKVEALKEVNLVVKRGEMLTIMGPSGSGKTTLLSIIGGLLKPTEGHVFYDETYIWSLEDKEISKLRALELGFVFQSSDLISTLSLLENVALPAILAGIPVKKSLLKAEKILLKLDLGERKFFYPRQLSGGEKRRGALARSLINSPSFILADEPTGDLDIDSSKMVANELLSLRDVGKGVVVVTHDPELASLGDKQYLIKHGRLIEKE